MKSALFSQILNGIVSYTQSRSTLRRFRDWFSPIAWDIEESEDSAAIELAYSIDGILMESTSGGWSESDLKRELANAIRPFEIIATPRRILPSTAVVIRAEADQRSALPYILTQFEQRPAAAEAA